MNTWRSLARKRNEIKVRFKPIFINKYSGVSLHECTKRNCHYCRIINDIDSGQRNDVFNPYKSCR